MRVESLRHAPLLLSGLLLVNLSLSGCAGGASGGAGPAATKGTQALLARHACCASELDGVVRQLKGELARRAKVRQVVGAAAATTPPDPAIAQAKERLATAKVHYLALKLKPARKELEQALDALKKAHAVGLNEQLAETHLYLAGVSYAERDREGMAGHCAAVMRYRPEIVVDQDVFSPPVHRCLKKARKQRQRKVRLVSSPPGATVFWDGRRLGKAPVELASVAEGAHYLALRHPLFQPWQRQLHVAADVEIPATLVPLAPAQIVAAVAKDPTLGSVAAAALQVDALIVVQDSNPEQLRYTAANTKKHSAGQLSRVSPSARIAALVEGLLPARMTREGGTKSRWWIWVVAAGGAVAAGAATAAIVASGSSGGDDPRPFRLPLP